MKQALLSLLIFCSTLLFSQKYTDVLLKNDLLRFANVSMLVKDLNTGKVLAQHNPHHAMVPASTMKLVTTAAALEMLGAGYSFTTTLEVDGEITKQGVLKGNLYIRGGGDPTLGSEKAGDNGFLSKWVDAVKRTGILQIEGKLIAIETCYDSQLINPQWTWQDMGNYYAPAIHGISYRDNTYKLYFAPAKIGDTPQILRTDPKTEGLTFNNQVICTETKSDNAYIYGAPYSLERAIQGEIPANKTDFFIKGDLPHPAKILLSDFRNALQKEGISISGFEFAGSKVNNTKPVYTHSSPALNELITEINVNSNNHYTEYLFKQLSTTQNTAGNNDLSVQKIRDFWKTQGLSTTELFQYDGSGLAPANAVSANFYVQLLEYMKLKSKNFQPFYASLAVSGTSGTLKNFMNTPACKGKVAAKSGTIARVRCYTGYMTTKKGTIGFAVLVNNANGTAKEVSQKIEEFLKQFMP